MSINFLDKLESRRFKGMLTDMSNALAEGRNTYHGTAAEAYRKAMTNWDGKRVYL